MTAPPQPPVVSSVFPVVPLLQDSPPGLLTQCEVNEAGGQHRLSTVITQRDGTAMCQGHHSSSSSFFMYEALTMENSLLCLILGSLTSPVCICTFVWYGPLYSPQPVLHIPFVLCLSHASMGFILLNTCCPILVFF